MNKKNILTAAGIILSFTIAVGGWVLISSLIEIKSGKLLSKTLSVATNTLDNISAGIMSEITDSEKDDKLLAQPTLSENDVVSILSNWSSAGHATPHEPTGEQLNMEQAIAAGQEWLSFIGGLNIFHNDLPHLNNARANLCQNLLSGQSGQFLPPEYSYWTVTFTSESVNVTMIINAVTGQVWKTDFDILKSDIDISDYDITNTLVAFVSVLNINKDENGEIITDGLVITSIESGNKNETIEEMDNVPLFTVTTRDFDSLADSYTFANGNANAVVMATGWRLEDGRWNINNFSIHLK